jgi:uncharacterized RDD family membrane protein YckC
MTSTSERHLGARAVAAAIDYAVFGAFYFGYIYYFGSESGEGYEVQGCGHFLFLVAAWIAWLPFTEACFGRSLGKWGLDLRVVNLNGTPIRPVQAFIRHALDPIDMSFFGLVGIIVAKTNALGQRVGDLVAKTRVVKDEPPPVGAA